MHKNEPNNVPPPAESAPEPETGKLDIVERIMQVGLQAFMLAGVGWSLYRGQYFTAFLVVMAMAITLMPTVLKQADILNVPAEVSIVTALFLFGSIFLGELQRFYDKFWWWDSLLHAISGLLLAYVALVIIFLVNRQMKAQLHRRPILIGIFVIIFTLAAAAAWEIFEFAVDQTLGMKMQDNNTDTMVDIILALGGSIIIASMAYMRIRFGTRFKVMSLVMRFLSDNPELMTEDKVPDMKVASDDQPHGTPHEDSL